MSLFRQKSLPEIPYDREAQTPAVRRSICTGEMTAGFLDRATGKFQDYMLLRDRQELEGFCRRTGVRPEELKTIY